ncbi:MAG: RNA-binding domain-containing protein [Thermoplasmata archaeon]
MLTVEASVKPSEDGEKVRRAMLNIFPDLKFEEVESGGREQGPEERGTAEERIVEGGEGRGGGTGNGTGKETWAGECVGGKGEGKPPAGEQRGPEPVIQSATGAVTVQPEYRLVGRGESVAKFAELLRRQRIRDAARRVLLKGMKGESLTVFRLNKQAAFVGKVSFSEGESPLGDITVRLEHPGLMALIDSVAPDTRKQLKLGGKRVATGGKGIWREAHLQWKRGEPWDWRRELEGGGEDEEE